jgi:hypothetical protein
VSPSILSPTKRPSRPSLIHALFWFDCFGISGHGVTHIPEVASYQEFIKTLSKPRYTQHFAQLAHCSSNTPVPNLETNNSPDIISDWLVLQSSNLGHGLDFDPGRVLRLLSSSISYSGFTSAVRLPLIGNLIEPRPDHSSHHFLIFVYWLVKPIDITKYTTQIRVKPTLPQVFIRQRADSRHLISKGPTALSDDR